MIEPRAVSPRGAVGVRVPRLRRRSAQRRGARGGAGGRLDHRPAGRVRADGAGPGTRGSRRAGRLRTDPRRRRPNARDAPAPDRHRRRLPVAQPRRADAVRRREPAGEDGPAARLRPRRSHLHPGRGDRGAPSAGRRSPHRLAGGGAHRHPPAPAGRGRTGRRGRRRRSTPGRAFLSFQPRHLRRRVRPHPARVRRRQPGLARALQLQRQGFLPGMQGPGLPGGRAVVPRRRAPGLQGLRRQAVPRRRPGADLARPVAVHPLGRRSAAAQARLRADPDRQRLRHGRADHRPPPGRHRPPARHRRPAHRRRQHGGRHRAQPGRHRRRRLDRLPGTGGRKRRRRHRRRGHAGSRRGTTHPELHGTLSQGAPACLSRSRRAAPRSSGRRSRGAPCGCPPPR